jgi:hypothetical protein
MAKRTRLPTIMLGRSMRGSSATAENPDVTFELEAETGEIFEVNFTLRGILSTVVMAHSWSPVKDELAQMGPPTKVNDRSERQQMASSEISCSYCRKTAPEVLQMIAGWDGAFICNECVQLCVGSIAAQNPEWLEQHRQFLAPLSDVTS